MTCEPDRMKRSARRPFGDLARDPGTWALSATRLKRAADQLRQSAWPEARRRNDVLAATADFMIGPVYMMLMGLAVENVLKAMVIAREPGNVEEQKLSTLICQHDLRRLWHRVGLRRCPEYDRELTRLETFVVSLGRYPVTKLKRDMDRTVGAGFHGQAAFPTMDRLWVFLQREFTNLCPDIGLDE